MSGTTNEGWEGPRAVRLEDARKMVEWEGVMADFERRIAALEAKVLQQDRVGATNYFSDRIAEGVSAAQRCLESVEAMFRALSEAETRVDMSNESAPLAEREMPACPTGDLVNAAWYSARPPAPQEPPERLAVAYLKAKWRKESLRRAFGPLLSGASRVRSCWALREALLNIPSVIQEPSFRQK